jgi:hypothetical protein
MGGVRRRLGSACLAAAALCAAGAMVLPSSSAQEAEVADAPDVFRGEATSVVASVEVDRDGLLPVADLLRVIALDGSSTFESSSQRARASLLFPGNGLVLGPSLLCGTFGGAFPAELKPLIDLCLQYDYPLSVVADSFSPDAATGGSLVLGNPGDPVSGRAIAARAHADPDGASSEATLHELRLLGLPAIGPIPLPLPGVELDASLLTVGAATSRTDQRIEDGTLVVRAEASLSDVRLLGGLVRVGTIRSASHVTDDGRGAQTATSDLEVGGVTVAGLPAQITPDGLVIGEPTGVLGPLLQQVQVQLNGLLDALGVRLTLLDGEETTDETGPAVASAQGLLLEVGQEIQGLPSVPGPLGDIDLNGLYAGSIQIGHTAARGVAAVIDDEVVAPPEDTGTGVGGPIDLGDRPPSLDLGGPLPTATPPAVPDPPPTAPDDRRPELVAVVDDLLADRMRLLYLAFTLSVLGLCLAPRFALPARLPHA